MKLTQGQRVRVRALETNREWSDGLVLLASQNGKSVAVQIDSPVALPGGQIIGGVLALVIDWKQETIVGLFGEKYEMEVLDTEASASR